MYYKIYRRRNRLYIIIGVILLIFLYFDKDSSKDNERKDSLNDLDEVFKVIEEKFEHKPRKRYVQPDPCVGCPGENGEGVKLTVSSNFIDQLFKFLQIILKPEEEVGIEAIYKKEFFNLRASDKISLWRSLPDSRNKEYGKKILSII